MKSRDTGNTKLQPNAQALPSPIQIIRQYYQAVDAADIAAALSEYADDCVYIRCGECFSGIKEIEKFFFVDRKLRGTHEITTMHEIANGVAVEGVFEGTNRYGDSIRVPFADFFFFNQQNKINRRHTYLMVGRALIH